MGSLPGESPGEGEGRGGSRATNGGCQMWKHLTSSSRLRGEERSAKRQKASAEAANPGSPLGEPTCTLPTKSESVIVGYYALKKRVSPGTLVRKTKREKEVRRWQETTERTGQA